MVELLAGGFRNADEALLRLNGQRGAVRSRFIYMYIGQAMHPLTA